jgi:hypothetical protein
MGSPEILTLACGLMMAILFFRRSSVDALIEIIERFTNNFRGGPPAPMHPLPSDDGALLRRRPRRARR